MTAKEAISTIRKDARGEMLPWVGSEMPLLEVLPRLLDSPGRLLEVRGEDSSLGIIDQTSFLEALGRQIASRDDSSMLTIECAPGDFSASHIARAVEDADVHLVDMLTNVGAEGRLLVTLRVRCVDPSHVAHSLERYGYEVTEMHGETVGHEEVALERWLGLQAMINV